MDQIMPKPNVDSIDLQTDRAMTLIASCDLGVHRLERVPSSDTTFPDAAFKVDLLFANKSGVRFGFEPYGACAYFSADTTVRGIKVVTPGGLEWKHEPSIRNQPEILF